MDVTDIESVMERRYWRNSQIPLAGL